MSILNKTDINLISGEFDCEIIQHLLLPNRGLECIIFLSGCTSLRVLDLSYNSVSDLKPISNLLHLEILILNSNKILNLHALSSLVRLYKLELAGNCIASFDDLISLGPLYNLNHLVLAMYSKCLRNPICDLPNYFSSVIDILPSLHFLDFVTTHPSKVSLINTVFQASTAKLDQVSSSTLSDKRLEWEKTWTKRFSHLEDRFDSEYKKVNNSINNSLVLLDAELNKLKHTGEAM